jgi:hypothetical protein
VVWLARDLPGEARQFAGDATATDVRFFAVGVEVRPAAMPAQLGAPHRLDRG